MKAISILALAAVLAGGCVSQSRYVELESLYFDANDQLRTVRRQVADEQREKEALRVELENTANRLSALQASLDQLRQARDSEIAELEARVREVKDAGSTRAKLLTAELEDARRLRDQQVAALETELERAREEARKRAEELDRINRTYGELVDNLKNEIQQGEVTISRLRGRLTVNLIDRILFESGSAELNAAGLAVLAKVSDVLKQVDDRVVSVEGHTDNVPIAASSRTRFPTNWELSTARASTVVRFLTDNGVAPEKLSATGYAYHRPVAANDTPENRRLNRRIEIVLLPLLDDSQAPAAEGTSL